ncbi:MAG: response regulator [Gammaproteobacteria bacterium]|nr:response regulator [Gammaproteobacteria bacterium]
MNIKRKNILIIDDELFILKSLSRILEDDYDVTTALGGKIALELLKQNNQYDLIISDISMPDTNGVEMYKIISKEYPGLEEKIIFMTGFAYTDDIVNFLAEIKNPFLAKPFEVDSLNTTIKNFLIDKK